MNDKFHEHGLELSFQAYQSLPCVLLLYQNKLLCFKYGVSQGYEEMDLKLYHKYKVIAHALIYYSLKHEKRYERLDQLCPKLITRLIDEFYDDQDQDKISGLDNKNETQGAVKLKQLSLQEMMKIASSLYLSELHRITQILRQKVGQDEDGITTSNGQGQCSKPWMTPLLVIVSGPASPRIGHPAMQYFGRLTKNKVIHEEMCIHGIDVGEGNSDNSNQEKGTARGGIHTKIKDRYLYYVENAQNWVDAMKIGLSLYVEETIYSKYQSMETDILAQHGYDYLDSKCCPNYTNA